MPQCHLDNNNSWSASARYLTHVGENFNASFHRGLLNRVQPVTVVHPEDPLEQLHKNWLTGLEDREQVKRLRINTMRESEE